MAEVPISRRRSALYAGLVVGLCFIGLESLLAAAGVSPLGDRGDPYGGFAGSSPLFVEESGWLRVSPERRRFFNDQRFPARKPADARRIFCLGGSTTYGRPYHHPTSFCGWLEAYLAEAQPDVAWEVVNAGGISYASYRVRRVMQELAGYAPDGFVLYTGHNEFLEERTYAALRAVPAPLRRADGLLRATRTYSTLRLVMDAALGRSAGAGPLLPEEVEAVLDTSVGLEAYERDDLQQQRAIAHFRSNLEAMVGLADRADAALVLVRPASNLRDCTPFKSSPTDGLAPEPQARAGAALSEGRDLLGAGRAREAAKRLETAAALDPRRAEVHYALGRARLAAMDSDGAEAAFRRAREEDVCPLRALESMEQTVASVALEHGVALVDFPALVRSWTRAATGHGIAVREFFLDHVHPTVEGSRRLALAILGELRRLGLVTADAELGPEAIAAVTARVESGIDARERALALRNLAKVLSWAGKTDDAAELAHEALKALPGDAESLFIAAVGDAARGRLEQAAAGYRAAVEADPEYAKAWNNLGVALAAVGRYDEAASAYHEGLALGAGGENVHFNLANALRRSGRLEEATAHYLEVIYARPEDADAHFNLARCYEDRGRAEKAAEHYRRAAQLESRAR